MRPSRSQCRVTGNGGGEDSSRLSDEAQTTPLFGLNFGSGPGLPRSTLKGPLRKRGRFGVACAMTPAKTRTARPPSSGEWSPPKREPNHEPHHPNACGAILAATLTVVIIVFRAGDGTMSVMPTSEYDGDEDSIVSEIDSFS